MSKQEEPVPAREFGTQGSPRVVLPAPVAPVAGGSAQSGAPGSEPKRVRTVTIRPDGTDLSGRPVGSLPPAPAQRSAAAPPAPTPPAPRAAAPAPRSGGPISLDAGDAAPARTRTAALPAEADGEPSSAGGFVVQLSSQKSESEAQAVFRTLQAKFPSELGGRQPLIRRADLGSKGVFYRTMVGPFASARDASQFCATYKAAGGQCMVPIN
jgi:hypothetical protein